MPVEIKELIIKVRVEDSTKKNDTSINTKSLKNDIMKEVRHEMQKQLRKLGER